MPENPWIKQMDRYIDDMEEEREHLEHVMASPRFEKEWMKKNRLELYAAMTELALTGQTHDCENLAADMIDWAKDYEGSYF